MAIDVSRSTPHGLNQSALRAQKAFFIRISRAADSEGEYDTQIVAKLTPVQLAKELKTLEKQMYQFAEEPSSSGFIHRPLH
jgi:hypothetical protein